MSNGADYAFGNPAFWASAPWISSLKAAGVQWAGRYVSTDAANDGNGKNLLPAEAKALRAAGISVVLFAEEDSATWMLGGHPAGVAIATHFDAVAKALGLPGVAMYCCADFDATPAEQAAVNDCLDGAGSVVGRSRVGIYGGYYTVNRALNAGKAKYACQTIAWSSTTRDFAPAPDHAVKVQVGTGYYWFDSRCSIRQGLQKLILAHDIDQDTAMTADFGQWPPPSVSPPPPPAVLRTVPNVTGMTQQDAAGVLWAAGLHPHGLPLARVTAQSPAAGAKVPDGSTVTITTT